MAEEDKDDKKDPRDQDTPPPEVSAGGGTSIFGDLDWDSELNAWDAALPIPSAPPPPLPTPPPDVPIRIEPEETSRFSAPELTPQPEETPPPDPFAVDTPVVERLPDFEPDMVSLFDSDAPAEEPVALTFAFSAAAIPTPALPKGLVNKDPAALDRRVWRDQVAFWTDEVAAIREQGGEGAGGRMEMAALAGARAAEQAESAEVAHRFYDEALALDPGCLVALRGRLRLTADGRPPEERRETLMALAAGATAEAPAYQNLVNEFDLLAGTVPAESEAPGADASPARFLASAEEALRASSHAEAADRLAAAGRLLKSTVGAAYLGLAARLRELAGEEDASVALWNEARSFDPDPAGAAFSALRRAVPRDGEAAQRLLDEAAVLPAPISIAVLRWSARLAGKADRPDEAHALLARTVSYQPATALPERDRLVLAATDATLAESLSPEGRLMLALRRADTNQALPAEALEILRTAAKDDRNAVPIGLRAEELGDTLADNQLRAAAFAVWADADPARRAFAHRLRAEALKAAGAAVEWREALAAASLAAPGDPVFWELAWARLRAGDREGASDAFELAAGGWGAQGAQEISVALEERAAELRAATSPAEAIGRALALAVTDDDDDPGIVVAQMLDADAKPATIGARLRQLAPGGMTLRALEAAGWALQAGEGREALSWLMGRLEGAANPAIAGLLRRMVRLYADPAGRPPLLGALAVASGSGPARALLEIQRAEALEAAGDRDAAVVLYRHLLGGTMARDAAFALRRLLWSMRDGEALAHLAADEAEAHARAGRGQDAGAAWFEQARVVADLLADDGRMETALRAAHDQDRHNPAARMALLTHTARKGRLAEVVPLLEESAAHELNAWNGPLLYVAALVDEGRGGGRQAARLARAAIAGEEPVPLALRVRALAAAVRESPLVAASAEAHEALARTVAALPSSDPRARAVLLAHAGRIRQGLGDPRAAEAFLREALVADPQFLPALLDLRRLLVGRGEWEEASDLCAGEAEAARSPAHQSARWLLRARIAETKLTDPELALRSLTSAVEVDPHNRVAFDELCDLRERRGDHRGLADALSLRLRASPDELETASLHMGRSKLLAGPLGDRGAAKEEMRALIAKQPQNTEAIARLAALELEDGGFAAAAELSIRQARLEKDPQRLRDVFLRIGRIHAQKLADPKVAISAFERVVQLDRENREGMEALSELYTQQNEPQKALAVTDALIERETDPERRLPFVLRAATLWEGLGNQARSATYLKRAAQECPRNVKAVGALAQHHERAHEAQARAVLLDGSIALLRADLQRAPGDLEALRAVVSMLRWRPRAASAAAAAQLLGLLSPDPTDRHAGAGTRQEGRRLAPLVRTDVEELALPSTLPRGLRGLLRLFGPALRKSGKPNLQQWDVGRADRVGSGDQVRAVAEAMASDLGVRTFDVYLAKTHSRALAVEPGDTPALVIGRDVVAMGPTAVRFACAYGIRLAATHFDLLVAAGAQQAATFLGGIVRALNPDFTHPDLSGPAMAAATTRATKALGKSLRIELAPYAAELATPFVADRLFLSLQETAAWAGLLACGDLAVALRVLCLAHGKPADADAIAGTPVALALIDFALSHEHEELVSALA